MTDDENQIDSDQELAEVVRVAIEESGLKHKDICNEMGLDAANGSKKIKNGSIVARTEDLFKFYELTKSHS